MVFCDADARDYPDYLTAALRLLRPGGVVAFNDVLLSDDSWQPGGPRSGEAREPDLASIVRDDERLVPMLLPLGDGLLAAVKRGA
jgi:predicted O-methyltransferase YrrM